MNRKQLNSIDMIGTVVSYMNEHQGTWGSVKAVAATIQALDEKLVGLQGKLQRQQTPTSGSTDEKDQVRLELQGSLLELAHETAAMAQGRGDVELVAKCTITRSAMKRLTNDELEATAVRVGQLAKAHLEHLGDSGITAADLAAFEALIVRFGNAKTRPRRAVANRSAETLTLPEAIRETVGLLRQRLDKQVTRFRRSHPEFATGYDRARVVVDRGSRAAAEPQGQTATPTPAPVTPPTLPQPQTALAA